MAKMDSTTARLIDATLKTVATLSLYLACISLAALVLLFVGVIGLRFFGVSIPSADDIASILLGGTFALGFAAAVPKDQHISVDFFIEKMGERSAAFLRFVGFVAMIGIFGYLLIGFWRMWYAAFQSGITMLGTLPIPRAVPMGVVLVGIVMLELALLLRFAQRLLDVGFGAPARDPLEGEF